MKKIAAMRKDELIDLLIKYNLEIPDDATKKELIDILNENNIDDDFVSTMDDDVTPASAANVQNDYGNKVPVKMNRANVIFIYKKYSFTKEDPIALVDIDIAYELINKFNGFKILDTSELERFAKNN